MQQIHTKINLVEMPQYGQKSTYFCIVGSCCVGYGGVIFDLNYCYDSVSKITSCLLRNPRSFVCPQLLLNADHL